MKRPRLISSAQSRSLGGISLIVDVDINIGAVGHLQSIFHLEAMARCHSQRSQQHIYVGRTVGRADLDSLLLRGIVG